MNTHQVTKVRQQLTAAIASVEAEIAVVAAGKLSVSTNSELDFIRSKLVEMLESLNMGKKIAIPGLWRIVTDTWPHTNTVRQQIVESELSYERLK